MRNRVSGWELWRRRHPLACGVAEGALAAGLATMVTAATVMGGAAWGALAWAGVACGRPVAYQAASASMMALLLDAAAGRAPGSSLAAVAGALVASALAGTRPENRLRVEHGLFAARAAAGWLIMQTILGLAAPGRFGPPTGWEALPATACALLLSALVIATVRWAFTPATHQLSLSRVDA